MSTRIRTADWPLPLLGYTLLTAAFFAPLGTRLLDEQIGGGDSLESLWNAWWVGQSLLRLENPWFTELLFAPEGTPLVWHSLAPVTSAAVTMLSWGLPVVVAYNVLVLAALPLAGMSAWALCRHLTGDVAASFVGGLAFMLSPFLTSKTLGHLDLLYGGLLPLFYLALLRAVDAGDAGRARAWQLAGASLLILFSCNPSVTVFAANLTFFLLCWHVWREGIGTASARFTQAFAPTFALCLPYVVLVVAYSIAWDYPPRIHSDLDYDPEIVSYLLPLTKTSWWSGWWTGWLSGWTGSLDFVRGPGPGLDEVEPAVYLGIAVLPLAAYGLWMRRDDLRIAHLALVGLVFLTFSLGAKLQWQREVVEIAGVSLYLPFGLWRWVPVLGTVGQAGRYALITYMVMGVGVACAVASLRERVPPAAMLLVTLGVSGIVAFDFGFAPIASPLPAPIDLTGAAPGRSRLLDPRLGSPETMYQQTLHGKPLIGGYVSRTPPGVLERYETDPVLGWFFRRDAGPAPSRTAMIGRLDALAVGAVLLSPGDPRGEVLADYGFTQRVTNPYTAVWTR